MNKMLTGFFILVAINLVASLWVISVGYTVIHNSNPPLPGGGEPTQINQDQDGLHKQDSAPEQRGTKDAPFVVYVEKSYADQEAAKNYEHRANENTRTQFMQALFNGGLLAIQLIILGIQLWIMKGGLEETRKANVAAKASADATKRALEIAERAEVQIVTMSFYPYPRVGPEIGFQITYKNFGRTGAREVITEIFHFQFPELKQTSQAIVLAPDASNTSAVQLTGIYRFPSDEELAKINAGDGVFVLGLWIKFIDVFDIRHRVAYSITYRGSTRGFDHSCTEYHHEQA